MSRPRYSAATQEELLRVEAAAIQKLRDMTNRRKRDTEFDKLLHSMGWTYDEQWGQYCKPDGSWCVGDDCYTLEEAFEFLSH